MGRASSGDVPCMDRTSVGSPLAGGFSADMYFLVSVLENEFLYWVVCNGRCLLFGGQSLFLAQLHVRVLWKASLNRACHS